MSNKRQAPYRHPDGSGCWTKNCTRQAPAAPMDLKSATAELNRIQTEHTNKANLWVMECIQTGTNPADMPEELRESIKTLNTAKINFQEALNAENKRRLGDQPVQRILDRHDPEFLKTLKAKGY